MKTLRTLIAGIIIGAMLMSAVTAFADSQTIEAFFNNIKISIDGKVIELKDAAGNPVQPFIYNGTTNAPIRAIAEALNYKVKMNETTNTIELIKAKEVKEVKQLDITKQWSIDDVKTITEDEYLQVQVRPDGTKYIYSHSYMLYLNKKAAREYLAKWNEKYPELSKTSSVVMEADETNSTVNFILKHYNGEKIVLMQNVPVFDDGGTYMLPYNEYINNILPKLIEAIKQNQ